jgi:hypothetical protein
MHCTTHAFKKAFHTDRNLEQQFVAQGCKTNHCIFQVDLQFTSRNKNPEKQKVVSALNLRRLYIFSHDFIALLNYVSINQCHYFAM